MCLKTNWWEFVIIRRENILRGRYKTKLELSQLNLATIFCEEATTIGNIIVVNDSERTKQKSGYINSFLLHFIWFKFVMSSLLLKLLHIGFPLTRYLMALFSHANLILHIVYATCFSNFSPLPLGDAFFIFLR